MSCQATLEKGSDLTPPSHNSTGQDGASDGDMDCDCKDCDPMDFSFMDDPSLTPMMRMATFLNEFVLVFNKVHLRIPTEGQQYIQFVDDIFAVFKALDDAAIETLIGINACIHTAIPRTQAPEGRRIFIQLDTSESGCSWSVRDEALDDDLDDDP
ncbi:hypothetical protein P692DRAFT_20865563 [Suillus brevipes Sb2]|nr:hypothetical protein P692DRAFT_20865563 [Suillus brevipes Sb2]